MSKQDAIPKGGHFPEFDTTIKALNKIYQNSVSLNQAQAKAFSPDFKKFSESQQPEISAAFLDINQVCLKELDIMKEANATIAEYPNCFADLKQMHIELEQKQADLNKKIAAEKKAKSAAEKADEKVQNAQKKNSPDLGKLQSEAEKAHDIAQQALLDAEEEQQQYNTYFETYKKNFIDKMSDDLSQLATKELQPLDRFAQTANELGSAVLKLRKYHDAQIDQLQTVLNELEQVTIE